MILHSSSLVKYNTAILIITVMSVCLCSCGQTVIIPAAYDVALCSSFPQDNISGKTLHSHLGLGGYNEINNAIYTFPAAYIGSNRSSDGKDAVALGGFDLSQITPNFKSAKLKFYINRCAADRRDVMVFIRPIRTPWDESTASFSTFYIYDDTIDDYILRHNVEKDETQCVLALFDIKANHESDEYSDTIPYKHSYRTVTVNITDIIKAALNRKAQFFGLLLDPVSSLDYRYRTKNARNEISDSGIIQIATSEWITFSKQDKDGIRYMENNAFGRINYVPRIEFEY